MEQKMRCSHCGAEVNGTDVFCGECGAPFVRRTLKTKGGVYYKAWNCRERQKGQKGNGCRCRLISEESLIDEIELTSRFKRKALFSFVIKYAAPICIVLILVSSVLDVFGIFKI